MIRKIQLNKKIWFGIIILELIILGGALSVVRRQPLVELNYTQDDLVGDSGEAVFYADQLSGIKYVTTPDFTLPKGFYTLDAEVERMGSTRLEVVYSDRYIYENVSDTIDLSDYSDVSFDFKVGHSDKTMSVHGRLGGDAGEMDYILIRNIRIVSAPAMNMRNTLFLLFVFFLAADVLLLMICYRERIVLTEEVKFHIKVLVLLTAVVSIPLMTGYLFKNAHDVQFHLTRIEGIKEELLNGHFPVRMQSYWLHGYGYPSSVFYGDILLYIPALLRICGVSVQASYIFYVVLINAGTVFISFFCFSKMGTPKTGMICTAIFALNIYRLLDIYSRMGVGEYTAIMFMPLVLYGLWRIYTLPEDSEEHGRSWIPLAIGCVGIFLSHILSTEMTALFIILPVVILRKKTFRKKNFLVLLKAAAATVLLSLWFLIPFLDYMANGTYVINDPYGYTPYNLESRGVFPAQLFMNVYSVTHGSTAIASGTVSDMPLTVGLASMLVLAGWFVFCFGKKRDDTEKKEEYLAVSLSVLSLAMTMYFFPYTWLADKIPVLKMAVRSIQYPWRFFAIAEIFLMWLLCIILQKDWIDRKRKQIFACTLVMTAFWQGITYMSGVLNEAEAMYSYQEVSTMGVEGGEYLPDNWQDGYRISDLTDNYANRLIYDEDSVSVSDWYRDRGAVVMSLTNNTQQTQQVEVPLLNYKGYHAIGDNGGELQILPEALPCISVSVPSDYSGTIRVEFREPWYWRLCELISLGALLCMIFFPFVRKRIQEKQDKALL